MKYLKKFEEHEKFKIGDYITYDINVYNFNKIVLIANKPYELKKIFNSNLGIIFCEDNHEAKLILNDKHIKKISNEEAKILLNTIKYNI